MSYISKQERMGLEELFVSIEQSRYLPHYKRTLVMLSKFAKQYPSRVIKIFKALRG